MTNKFTVVSFINPVNGMSGDIEVVGTKTNREDAIDLAIGHALYSYGVTISDRTMADGAEFISFNKKAKISYAII